MLRNATSWLRTAVRDWGVLAALCYAVSNLCRRWFGSRVRVHLYRLQVLPVPERNMLPAHRGRQFEIREVQSGDPVLASLPRSAAVVQSRYDQGSRCYCAFHNGVLVGQFWLQFGSYLEDEVRTRFDLIPPADMAWDYDVYVDPQYRLTPLFAKLWDEMFSRLRQTGKRWCASRVSAWNTASLQSHKRLGAQDVGRSLYLIIGGRQLMISSLAPHVHVSGSIKSTPAVGVEVPRQWRVAAPRQ